MAKSEITYLCQVITKKGDQCQRSAEYMFNNRGMCSKHHAIALEKQKHERELLLKIENGTARCEDLSD